MEEIKQQPDKPEDDGPGPFQETLVAFIATVLFGAVFLVWAWHNIT